MEKFQVKKSLVIRLIALLIVVAMIVSAAFLYQSLTNPKNSILEKTSLRLKWVNQAQFAGYFMAAKNGHFKDGGLDVKIDPAGPNISPTQMVTSGVNEFGIAGADEVLQARAKGVPVVALAVIFKENPEALTSLKEANITKPSDLIGKKIGVIYGNDENLYREFLKKNNIDKSQLTEVAAVPGGSQLLSGQVDVIMAYSMNVPVLLKIQGKETNVMRFADYGVNFYGDTLFTTQEMVDKHPEKVKAFVKAISEGWRDAIEQPEVAVNEVMRINPTLNREAQIGYLKGVGPLVQKGNKIGESDKKVWDSMQDTLVDLNVIKQRIDVTSAYTNKFLE